jgi:hypothetical protein
MCGRIQLSVARRGFGRQGTTWSSLDAVGGNVRDKVASQLVAAGDSGAAAGKSLCRKFFLEPVVEETSL